jgi:hypothetical protein
MAELFGQAGISDSINEEFGIEYLAELIVRECAEVALWEQGKGYDVGETIKQHFGVE